MRLLPVVAGAIVPHAPLLLPQLESPEVAGAAIAIREAVQRIDIKDAEALVLLTPHGRKPGVYRSASGDLHSFGVPDVQVTVDPWELPGVPAVDGPLDHGAVVPLALRDWAVPVAVVATGGGPQLALQTDRRVVVVVSANLSAGLTSRAPLTEIAGAREAEERFVEALQEDVGLSTEQDLPGTCSGAVIQAFAKLFAGRRARVLAHEAPVGVGYLVAEIE